MPGRGQSDAAALVRDAADRRTFPKTLKRFKTIDEPTLRAILRSVADELDDAGGATPPLSPPPKSVGRGARRIPSPGLPREGSAVIRIDGASRGNPGPAAAAAILETRDGNEIARAAEPLGVTTNNQAEYRALLVGLEKALELGVSNVEIRSDSELLVRQMNGEYKVKNSEIRDLKAMADELILRLRSISFTHVPREDNAEADRLANDVLDGKVTGG